MTSSVWGLSGSSPADLDMDGSLWVFDPHRYLYGGMRGGEEGFISSPSPVHGDAYGKAVAAVQAVIRQKRPRSPDCPPQVLPEEGSTSPLRKRRRQGRSSDSGSDSGVPPTDSTSLFSVPLSRSSLTLKVSGLAFEGDPQATFPSFVPSSVHGGLGGDAYEEAVVAAQAGSRQKRPRSPGGPLQANPGEDEANPPPSKKRKKRRPPDLGSYSGVPPTDSIPPSSVPLSRSSLTPKASGLAFEGDPQAAFPSSVRDRIKMEKPGSTRLAVTRIFSGIAAMGALYSLKGAGESGAVWSQCDEEVASFYAEAGRRAEALKKFQSDMRKKLNKMREQLDLTADGLYQAVRDEVAYDECISLKSRETDEDKEKSEEISSRVDRLYQSVIFQAESYYCWLATQGRVDSEWSVKRLMDQIDEIIAELRGS